MSECRAFEPELLVPLIDEFDGGMCERCEKRTRHVTQDGRSVCHRCNSEAEEEVGELKL